MRIDILTLLPGMFEGPLTESILKRAADSGALELHVHNIRDYSTMRHKQADDKPYGGGAGMLLMAEPIVRCIEAITCEGQESRKRQKGQKSRDKKSCVSATPYRIYLSAGGKRLTQSKVERLAKKDWILLLCGHYEGIDQRVIDGWIDEEISIGDYVLTGGEIPAMVIVDSVVRKIPGVLGKDVSADLDSFSKEFDRKREYPQYTRPEVFRDHKVPEVLLSGNHKKIEEWRESKLR
ncbi:tRNA (guanosine(37)-N1)-methyltransferase TrmD [Candidatus Peribacteria bacterium]|nr:tRNA (guanosine(37)-N1)-methyltransferase TrmD [Candidatus Peribacteria bacterium]